MQNSENLSDQKLYDLCKMFGSRALEARNKFLGLLPEVAARRLYEEKGFSSILEFAAKLAGVSHEQVQNVLNLDRQFQEKPALHNLLVTGEVSVNKLIRVASIATKTNQEELAKYVKLLPQTAVEVMVRDYKIRMAGRPGMDEMAGQNIGMFGDGLQKPVLDSIRLRAQPPTINISRDLKLINLLSEEVKEELSTLAEKGININAILLDALQKRKLEIAQAKEQMGQEMIAKSGGKVEQTTRYIPAKKKIY